MEYNTTRTKLRLPEYGRSIQQMVEYAMTLSDKEERQRCAYTIIELMANMQTFNGNAEDFYQKLWNHLAFISNYKLDIDYPVEIQNFDEQEAKRDIMPYPQKRIARRHYGSIIEQLAKKLMEMEPGGERDELIYLVANQMKVDLASWNSNALDDEKILSDLAEFTKGKVQLLPSEIQLMTNRQAIAYAQQIGSTGNGNGKKKKKK